MKTIPKRCVDKIQSLLHNLTEVDKSRTKGFLGLFPGGGEHLTCLPISKAKSIKILHPSICMDISFN